MSPVPKHIFSSRSLQPETLRARNLSVYKDSPLSANIVLTRLLLLHILPSLGCVFIGTAKPGGCSTLSNRSSLLLTELTVNIIVVASSSSHCQIYLAETAIGLQDTRAQDKLNSKVCTWYPKIILCVILLMFASLIVFLSSF